MGTTGSEMADKSSDSPPNPTPKPLSFTLFPNLPQELRLKIWRHTFEPRKITIRIESQGLISTSSSSKCPISLHICAESREEALKWYQLLFPNGPYPTYFNPIIDIPHVRHGPKDGPRVAPMPYLWHYKAFDFRVTFLNNLRKHFDAKFMSELRTLAIDRDIWVLRVESAPLMIQWFPRLERLVIVIDDEFLTDEDEWTDEEGSNGDTSFWRDMVGSQAQGPISDDTSNQYHPRAERDRYITRRLKLTTSTRDNSRFIEPQQSSRYAAFVKADVIEKLKDDAESSIGRSAVKVNIATEDRYA